MTGLHYPDNLYADHEERKARRSQAPTGAYRAPDPVVQRLRVLPLVNADLHKRVAKGSTEYGEPLTTHNGRDALWDAYEEALDLCLYLRQAIEERNQQSRNAKVAADNPPTVGAYPIEGVPPERVPKWDVRWGMGVTVSDGLQWNSAPPNCLHPMHAVAIQDHDERLAGGEDRL